MHSRGQQLRGIAITNTENKALRDENNLLREQLQQLKEMMKQMQNERTSLEQSVMSSANEAASASAITAADQSPSVAADVTVSAAHHQSPSVAADVTVSAAHHQSASVAANVTVSSGDVVRLVSDLGVLMSSDDCSKQLMNLYIAPDNQDIHLLSESGEIFGHVAQYSEILNMDDVTITHQQNPDAQESSEDDDVNLETREERKSKPARPCPLCEKMLPRLSRHIMTVHRDCDQVKKIMGLPSKARDLHLRQMRRQGILKFNKKQLLTDSPCLQRERRRKKNSEMAMCNHCCGFFARKHFWRHKITCRSDTATEPVAIPLSVMKSTSNNRFLPEEFRNEILTKFSNDLTGKLCQTDTSILTVGRRLYDKMKRKQDKLAEVGKSVRMDMRRLASLFMTFKEISGERCSDSCVHSDSSSMLVRSHFSSLEEAIDRRCIDADEIESASSKLKAGLKISYYYLLKKMAKIMKATFLERDEDSKAAEIDKFTDVLALNHNVVFGDAMYKINKNRQTKLRRPENLPREDDCQQLRDYTLQRIEQLTNDQFQFWSTSEYCELRDLVLSRLTLFNARRGGEPARLTMTEWQEAVEGRWLNSTSVNNSSDIERQLFREFKLTYQTGKGNNHLVPVLFPSDIVTATERLCDSAVRTSCGIHKNNAYVFPNSKHSLDHVSGWHSVNRVATDAKIHSPELLNPTKMRHLVSTLYAARDVPEKDRQLFYMHMGHSEKVNSAIYQAPLAHQEVTKVGYHLQQIDKCKQLFTSFFQTCHITATLLDSDWFNV